MSFQAKFDTDNDGMDTMEVARILRDIADRIEEGNVGNFRTIFDCNGNDVGRWKLEIIESDGHKTVHYAGKDRLSVK